MRRRRLRRVAAGLVALLVVGTFLLWPRSDRITEESFARIQKGMTRRQVEAILGPPGDYTTGPVDGLQAYRCGGSKPIVRLDEKTSLFFWIGDATLISVVLDEETGTTLGMDCHAVHKQPQSTLANLAWRAKRRWPRWFPEWASDWLFED
jgi:hypothetical protein